MSPKELMSMLTIVHNAIKWAFWGVKSLGFGHKFYLLLEFSGSVRENTHF